MNNGLLKEVIQDRGIKVSALADKMGISRQSLHMKLNGKRSFDQGEIMALKINLRLSDEEFMSIFLVTVWTNCPERKQYDLLRHSLSVARKALQESDGTRARCEQVKSLHVEMPDRTERVYQSG